MINEFTKLQNFILRKTNSKILKKVRKIFMFKGALMQI